MLDGGKLLHKPSPVSVSDVDSWGLAQAGGSLLKVTTKYKELEHTDLPCSICSLMGALSRSLHTHRLTFNFTLVCSYQEVTKQN